LQAFEDKAHDPEKAHGIVEERIEKLDKDRKQAKKNAGDARKNKEIARMLVKEERPKAEEAKNNEEEA